jgi:phenylalanyl-tRNA synthetase alpha chain
VFDRVEKLRADAESRIAAARGEPDLESVRVAFLGKKSELKGLLKSVGALPAEDRPRLGAAVNSAAKRIEELLEARRVELETGPAGSSTDSSATLRAGLDFTRPGFSRNRGLPHPLVETMDRIVEILVGLGYGVAEGPDIEDDAHNFSDLNFPPDHPARDAQDTFFLEPPRADEGGAEPLLLRTHTSPVQIRVMSLHAPPIAITVPGRTYRSDDVDATHSPIFHQVEGLVVGESITMADLKGTLEAFTAELFGPGYGIRFRPSFFPFTEPSAEVDVGCIACAGKDSGCRVCKGTGWLEILGAGMVDPNVLENVCRRRGDRAYDPECVTGFAFGMGVERIAMLRHGVDDMRLFFENDPRFLGMLAR